jgi:hypothetical protein
VELLPCDDEGPATKLLPALRAEPDSLLVVADDDMIYPVDFLETLLCAHRDRPAAAIGWRGWRMPPEADPHALDVVRAIDVKRTTAVDVLHGTWGYLLPPGALDEAVHRFEGWPDAARWVDDVWISGHLARRGVARWVAPAAGLPIDCASAAVAALSDGPNRAGENDRIVLRAFAPWWRQPALESAADPA